MCQKVPVLPCCLQVAGRPGLSLDALREMNAAVGNGPALEAGAERRGFVLEFPPALSPEQLSTAAGPGGPERQGATLVATPAGGFLECLAPCLLSSMESVWAPSGLCQHSCLMCARHHSQLCKQVLTCPVHCSAKLDPL